MLALNVLFFTTDWTAGMIRRKDGDNSGKHNISIDILFFPLYMTDEPTIMESTDSVAPPI
jgi:hypothetical protein